jgi:quercetin dioxygenase-like cupin family protein
MAYSGKRIVNPHSGQTIKFIITAKESKGEKLEMITSWLPHSQKPAEHYHPFQEEYFKVMEGELTITINHKETRVLKKGDVMYIPAGTTHAMWNNSSKQAVASWKVFPAYDTEYFLETGIGLAAAGKIGRNGMPGLLQISLLAQRFSREFRLKRPSYLVQQILFGLLKPIALLSGKQPIYKEYID